MALDTAVCLVILVGQSTCQFILMEAEKYFGKYLEMCVHLQELTYSRERNRNSGQDGDIGRHTLLP